MKIGIVGDGVVGAANRVGFERIGHYVTVHDVKYETELEWLTKGEIIFVCVPTPSREDGSCDTSIVESVLEELNTLHYRGIIAIRSSTVPGFTQSMIDKYSSLTICFVPEFIRERCALEDFTFNHSLLAVGTDDASVFEKIVRAHGDYPENIVQLRPTEAEILKYYLNLYAATRIIFANAFYEICEKFGANYKAVKDAYILTGRAGDMYLDATPDLRGYGGVCLPKDTKAIIQLMEENNIQLDLFKAVDSDNSKLKTTVFAGMRK